MVGLDSTVTDFFPVVSVVAISLLMLGVGVTVDCSGIPELR